MGRGVGRYSETKTQETTAVRLIKGYEGDLL